MVYTSNFGLCSISSVLFLITYLKGPRFSHASNENKMEAKVDDTQHVQEKNNDSSLHTDVMDSGAAAEFGESNQPICLVVLGMAGSGKTTFVHVSIVMRINRVSVMAIGCY